VTRRRDAGQRERRRSRERARKQSNLTHRKILEAKREVALKPWSANFKPILVVVAQPIELPECGF
jgi:hypothetical protein